MGKTTERLDRLEESVDELRSSLALHASAHIAQARDQAWPFAPAPAPEPRYVAVAFFTKQRLFSRTWTYIDGIGDLAVGDRVFCPTKYNGPYTGIVTRIGRGTDLIRSGGRYVNAAGDRYDGPFSKITTRMRDDQEGGGNSW